MERHGFTVLQEILLAALELYENAKMEFTEWDLTVAAWKRNKNRFGCRGYEKDYPDHKRVMMEIMSKRRKDTPLRQGWLEKTRPNYYRITSLGIAEAQKLKGMTKSRTNTVRAAQPIYDAVASYVFHPVFRKYLLDPEEPRTWLGSEAFLGLTRHDATTLDDRIRSVRNAAENAINWIIENGQTSMRSGASGGKKAIMLGEVEKLPEFIDVLETRFKIQIDAIRRHS
jgi:hypothetical protein